MTKRSPNTKPSEDYLLGLKHGFEASLLDDDTDETIDGTDANEEDLDGADKDEDLDGTDTDDEDDK